MFYYEALRSPYMVDWAINPNNQIKSNRPKIGNRLFLCNMDPIQANEPKKSLLTELAYGITHHSTL